jgi:hypothetical protein
MIICPLPVPYILITQLEPTLPDISCQVCNTPLIYTLCYPLRLQLPTNYYPTLSTTLLALCYTALLTIWSPQHLASPVSLAQQSHCQKAIASTQVYTAVQVHFLLPLSWPTTPLVITQGLSFLLIMSTTRQQTLNAILGTIELSTDTCTFLNNKNIKSIGALTSVTDDIFNQWVADDNAAFSVTDLGFINKFKQWYAEWMTTSPTVAVTEALTEQVWDAWIPPALRVNTNPTGTSAAASSAPAPAVPTAYARRSLESFPKFDGKPTHYTGFKLAFIATAESQDLGYLLESDYTAPTVPDLCFTTDNRFLYSALLICCNDGNAIQFVTPHRHDRDGIAAWKAINDYYYGSTTDTIAHTALLSLQKVNLRKSTGVEGYIKHFNTHLESLREANYPLDPRMAVIMFLNQIHEPAFTPTITYLRMSNADYPTCQRKLREAADALAVQDDANRHFRSLNNTSNNNNGNYQGSRGRNNRSSTRNDNSRNNNNTNGQSNINNSNNNQDTGNNSRPYTLNLPTSAFNAMSPEEHEQFTAARRNLVNQVNPRPNNGNNGNRNRSGNNRRGNRNNNNTSTSPSSVANPNDAATAVSNLTNDFASRVTNLINSGTRHSNNASTNNNNVAHPANPNRSLNLGCRFVDLSNQESSNRRAANIVQDLGDNQTIMIIDSGTDSTTVGKNCTIIETTDRKANLTGFHDTLNITNAPIVTAAFAYDAEEGPIILVVNEAVYLENNSTSLLSTVQAREHGILVDDCAKRHGGSQSIQIEELVIPLKLSSALMHIQLRKPTDYELANCDHYTLTSDQPWEPSTLNDTTPGFVVPPPSLAANHAMNNTNTIDTVTNDAANTTVTMHHVFYTLSTCMSLYNTYRRLSTAITTSINGISPTAVQSKLGWLPIDTIAKTIESTTQLAKSVPLRLPMRRHFRSRFPQLNRPRLAETVATDTYFSSVPAYGGYTCAQLFVGTKSLFVKAYGMQRESQGPQALEDFIRDIGAPHDIRSDNAKMQTGVEWSKICRQYNIAQQTTEPHHLWQNPAERKIQEVKKYVSTIMDCTHCPSKLWFLCTLYVVYLLNCTAMHDLN